MTTHPARVPLEPPSYLPCVAGDLDHHAVGRLTGRDQRVKPRPQSIGTEPAE